MLSLAKRLKAPIFQASTSEVYGDPAVHPQQEGDWGYVNSIGIRSCYDERRRDAEPLFFDYHRQHRLDTKVARISTLRSADAGWRWTVVSNFIAQTLLGEDITIYGDAQQTRLFCYVDDLIRIFLVFMDVGANIRGPINLGNPKKFTICELAERGWRK